MYYASIFTTSKNRCLILKWNLEKWNRKSLHRHRVRKATIFENNCDWNINMKKNWRVTKFALSRKLFYCNQSVDCAEGGRRGVAWRGVDGTDNSTNRPNCEADECAVFLFQFLSKNECCKWERAIYFIHSGVIAYDVIVNCISHSTFCDGILINCYDFMNI